ncbi:unnamed protein product [Darwinula stevensoni]|uniref:Purine nucleoside phosphorylase n=1 Tax=Darwinula stevensoni TaxID=69355 RepID=A0A7R8X6K7_9CRUS|nr:unnamed protein product [Darwinula stevensoni]CAG0882213.1 unnamed protein product [Darwinula stevensoni]
MEYDPGLVRIRQCAIEDAAGPSFPPIEFQAEQEAAHPVLQKRVCVVRVRLAPLPWLTINEVKKIADFIKNKVPCNPKIGIVCGSGLGVIGDRIRNGVYIKYEDIPGFLVSTVVGHRGALLIGDLNGVEVVCMLGRFHFYEGYPTWKCALPIRVMRFLGVETVIVTNAAGSVNPTYRVGDVMLLKDHLFLPSICGGLNPLIGPNDDKLGVRFPSLTTAYDKKLREIALETAEALGLRESFHEGVYVMNSGPAFETIAELNFLRSAGADAVGMSTLPEVVTARHCGLRVLAFSLITNECIMEYDSDKPHPTQEEVIETAEAKQEQISDFVFHLVSGMNKEALAC